MLPTVQFSLPLVTNTCSFAPQVRIATETLIGEQLKRRVGWNNDRKFLPAVAMIGTFQQSDFVISHCMDFLIKGSFMESLEDNCSAIADSGELGLLNCKWLLLVYRLLEMYQNQFGHADVSIEKSLKLPSSSLKQRLTARMEMIGE